MDGQTDGRRDKRTDDILWHNCALCSIGWHCSVVVSAVASTNVVNPHWARLLLGWVTAHRQVNRLCI